MLKRKILATLFAAVILCVTITSCAPATTESEVDAPDAGDTGTEAPADTGDTDEDAELEIWVYGWEKASADKVAEDAITYGEDNGLNITVTPVAVDSYSTKIQATLAGGTNPDLAFVDAGVQSVQLASKDKLLILNDYGVEEYKDKFYDSVWNTMVYQDEVHGLRITSNNLALFYNKELFDNAGLDYPTADWTWDDLRAAASELTDLDANVYGLDLPIYTDAGGYCWTWMPFLWQAGADFLNEDRTEAVFNSAEGVKALEFWKTMAYEDQSVPLQAAATGVDRFTSGGVAMSINGPWMLNPYVADPEFKDNFGIVPMPADVEEATVVGGEGVVIFNSTEYPQEAYDYLVHLTVSDFAQTFWENWITIPPQPEFKDFYADNSEFGEYIQVFSDQMADSKTRPFTPTWPQIEDTMGVDLQSYMFDQNDDAQATLDKAAENVNKLLVE